MAHSKLLDSLPFLPSLFSFFRLFTFLNTKKDTDSKTFFVTVGHWQFFLVNFVENLENYLPFLNLVS